MSEAPKRIQLSRAKGWRMPANTVKVSRPGVLGNPFTIAQAIESGFAGPETAQAFVVRVFREWLTSARGHRDWWQGEEADARKAAIHKAIPDLRGKDLACWCAPGKPCHADVLLEMANDGATAPRHNIDAEARS